VFNNNNNLNDDGLKTEYQSFFDPSHLQTTMSVLVTVSRNVRWPRRTLPPGDVSVPTGQSDGR